MIQAKAHAPKTKPRIVQRVTDRPRRHAINAVSGASDASIASEVAIMSAGSRCMPAKKKPDVIPTMVATVVTVEASSRLA
jgi:hypothetical protein